MAKMPRQRHSDDPPLPPLAAALAAARHRKRKSASQEERRAATQVAIAKVAEVSQATVSAWERGADKPQIERLPKVARAYGVPESRLRSLWMQTAIDEAA